MTALVDASTIHQRPAELLQRLIEFDTTNPPGDEAECMSFIGHLLDEAGIKYDVLAKSKDRPNLVARLPGQGNAPPLLLYGHVDVVTTTNQQWSHPPFAGEIVDGYVWGRGALDMKGGVAMMLAAFLRARAENLALPGDVVLAILSDEEAGGDFGARFLVEEHPELFAGIHYAIGEFGGFSLSIAGKRFYAIQIAEKQICWLKATVGGPGGHGSMPVRDGAMARLAQLLLQLDTNRMPVHVTAPARMTLEAMASEISGAVGQMFNQLLMPDRTDSVLDLLGEQGRIFDPLLHNTVCPTILHGSDKINVIPSQVSVELDGRLLPGYTPSDMIGELQSMVGDDVELELIRYDPGPAEPNMGLFEVLADILREADPEGVPVPLLLNAVTDGRFFSRLGIQTYGFLPMPLPDNFSFAQTIHAADERIPVAAVEFGTNAVYEVLGHFGDASV